MPARPRSTKLAGNKEAMAGAGAGAVGGKPAGHMPEDRDGKEELAGADSFPTDHGHAPAAGGGGESAIDGFEAGGWILIGAAGREEGGAWCCAGGGKIAEGAGEGFPADEGSRSGAKKVDALHHGVGF